MFLYPLIEILLFHYRSVSSEINYIFNFMGRQTSLAYNCFLNLDRSYYQKVSRQGFVIKIDVQAVAWLTKYLC